MSQRGLLIATFLVLPTLLSACGPDYRSYYPPAPPAGAYESYVRARIFREHGEYDKALEALDTALYLDAEAPRVRTEHADLLRLSGDLPRALLELDDIVSDHGDFLHARYVRALTRRDSGQIPGALDDLRTVTEVDPAHKPAAFELARLSIDKGDLGAARDVLEGYVAASPTTPEGWLALGNLTWEQDDHARAADAYEEFVDLQSHSEHAWLRLASANQSLDQMTEREDVLARCVEAVPASVECKISFIQSVVKRPQTDALDDRIDTLVLSVSHDTQTIDEQLLIQLALRILSSQPLEVSSPFVEAILLRRPDLGDLGYHLGRARLDTGDCHGAMRALQLVDLDSEVRIDADSLMGECQLRRGELEQAAATARTMIEQHPERTGGHLLFARVEVARGELDSALAALDGALAQGHQDQALHVEKALVYELRGEQDAAQDAYQKVLDRAADSEFAIPGAGGQALVRAREGLARILVAKGDQHTIRGESAEAVQNFQQALPHIDDDSVRIEVLNKIDALSVVGGSETRSHLPRTIDQ